MKKKEKKCFELFDQSLIFQAPKFGQFQIHLKKKEKKTTNNIKDKKSQKNASFFSSKMVLSHT